MKFGLTNDEQQIIIILAFILLVGAAVIGLQQGSFNFASTPPVTEAGDAQVAGAQ